VVLKTIVGVKADGSSNLPPSATKAQERVKSYIGYSMGNFYVKAWKINIPVAPLIVWWEVNYGKTILPEIICMMSFAGYIMWRLMWWKSMLEIKVYTQEKESI
jgi:hypothetical protein